jgi:hypothetical protein
MMNDGPSVDLAQGRASESQRNAERKGFRIAYPRIKWKLSSWNLSAN